MRCMLRQCGSLPIVQSRVCEHSPVALPQLTRRHSLLPCGSTQQSRRSNRRTRLTASRAQPRPLAPQTQPDFRISAQQILSSLEAVAWLCAAGLQACAFVLSHQQFQQRQQLLALQESESDSEYCQAEQPPVLQDTWTDHLCTSPSLITQSAVCAIIVAAIIGRCRQWLSHGRKQLADVGPETSASAQMVRLEALADRQTQSLTAVQRQVTKLQLRSGLMGHDVKPLLKTVQHENMQQAEVLHNHGAQLEAMKTDIQDTQKLLSALQSVSAKQFDLLLKLVKQQQQQQQQQPQQPRLQPVKKATAVEELDPALPHQA